jgi:hypothetical protein
MLVVVVVTVVLVDPVSFRADQTPLASEGLVGALLPSMAAAASRRERQILCIGIRIRDRLGE